MRQVLFLNGTLLLVLTLSVSATAQIQQGEIALNGDGMTQNEDDFGCCSPRGPTH